ncbi:MAG: pilin [Candidatus Woesebacteria bacterium]|nr:pilin [Candidatus Woesebacteria bacterium]
MKKYLLIFLFFGLFFSNTKQLFAQECFVAGKYGECSALTNCPSDTSTFYKNGYSPVNSCIDLGGCCIAFKKSDSSNPTCNGGNGIDTAIGCIPVNDTNVFMGWILGWAIGVGGGIAFLLIIYASFMVMTSQGNPERLKAGQELLTSAISGLILLIFSVFILRFIGIDILKLDKFGFGQ